MENKLKNSLSTNKTLLLISLLVILSGAFACVLGEIMIPVIVALLASLYLFDKKRIFCIVVTSLIVLLNIVAFILTLTVSIFAPASVILAWILCTAFKGSQSKSDTAYIMTIICTAFCLVSYLLFAMIEQGSYTIDAVIEYYTLLIDEFRVIFVEASVDWYASSGIVVAAESVEAIYNAQLNLIISYILIGGFIITGFSMKLFGAIVGKCSEDNTKIKNWRFSATRIYAYFYVALIFASLFATSDDSIFAVSVLNLYNIFLVVFAYIGFKVMLDIIGRRMRPVFAALILIAVIVIFSSIAAQILAALGVLYILRRNSPTPESK